MSEFSDPIRALAEIQATVIAAGGRGDERSPQARRWPQGRWRHWAVRA